MSKKASGAKIATVIIIALIVVALAFGLYFVTDGFTNWNLNVNCVVGNHKFDDAGICVSCGRQGVRSLTLYVDDMPTDGIVQSHAFYEGGKLTYQLNCVVKPDNAIQAKVSYTSDNESVAIVNETGIVTIVGEGEAIITASVKNGTSVQCKFVIDSGNYPNVLAFKQEKYYFDSTYVESDMLKTQTVQISTETSSDFDCDFVWESSDESVVRVLDSPLKNRRTIVLVGDGTATITATAPNKVTATANVYIGNRLALSMPGFNLKTVEIGKTYQIESNWLPGKLVDDGITAWYSSDESIATIDRETGLVTIVGYGDVTFKADVSKYSTAVDTELTISIPVPSVELYADSELIFSVPEVECLSINSPSFPIRYAKTYQLYGRAMPSKEVGNFTWSSSNEQVATVDNNGLVTAVGAGEAVITATAQNGASASCGVVVFVFAESVSITKDHESCLDGLKLYIGNNIELSADVSPISANRKDIRWESSNTNVATVDANGVVTAVSEGTAVISAMDYFTREYSNVKVDVSRPIESISIDYDYIPGVWNMNAEPASEIVLPIDRAERHIGMAPVTQLQLRTFVNPSNVDSSLQYVSADKSVASVDSEGRIVAKKVGTTVITVSSDNGVSESITVSVLYPPCQGISSITMPFSEGTRIVEELYYTFFTVVKSSNPSVATLGGNCVITARGTGTTQITVRTRDPGDWEQTWETTFTVTITEDFNTFAEYSWARIAELSNSGEAKNKFNVGDEKQVMLSTGEVLTFVILGFNHDDLQNGQKAGISLGLKDLMSTTSVFNETNTNVGGWNESHIRSYLNDTVFSLLPTDLRQVILSARKQTMVGNKSEQITISLDKLWLLSEVEIDGTSRTGNCNEGSQYAYWSAVRDGTDKTDRILECNGVAGTYWLRSPSTSTNDSFSYITTAGYIYNSGKATKDYGIYFGFCI